MWCVEWPKAPASEDPFEVKELASPKHCWNVSRRCLDANFPLISDKSRTEGSLLVTSEILGLCFNRLTSDHMYSRLKREIFPLLVRTQLYQKPKTFSGFSLHVWNIHEILNTLKKKRKRHSLNISYVIDTEECGFSNARKPLLQNTFLKSTS